MVSSEFHLPSQALFSIRSRTAVLILRLATKYFQTLALSSPHSLPVEFFCDSYFLYLLFSHWVVSHSLWSYGLQHTRLPCPSLSPGVCSSSCPLSQWCCLTHLILCHPLLLWPLIFPIIRIISSESALRIRWPKYWSFSFNIVFPMNIQGWFPLALTVQGTLKSLLQHHSLKVSILWCSAFFMSVRSFWLSLIKS